MTQFHFRSGSQLQLERGQPVAQGGIDQSVHMREQRFGKAGQRLDLVGAAGEIHLLSGQEAERAAPQVTEISLQRVGCR